MNRTEVEQFVLRYLNTTGSTILERGPAHIIAQLSPQADKALTGRTYYWSFVERTGVEPETMRLTFVFDEQEYNIWDQENPDDKGLRVHNQRLQRQEMVRFGSSRLNQLFQAVHQGGRFIQLFEQPHGLHAPYDNNVSSFAYTTWLAVNYKVSFICDMKRDELHSLGISLSTGEIQENFHHQMVPLTFSPNLPSRTYTKDRISLSKAITLLEKYVENKLVAYDHTWAKEAMERYQEELDRLETFYNPTSGHDAEDEKEHARKQYIHRQKEIEWQYKPRIEVNIINCGYFHLKTNPFRQR